MGYMKLKKHGCPMGYMKLKKHGGPMGYIKLKKHGGPMGYMKLMNMSALSSSTSTILPSTQNPPHMHVMK